MNQRNPSFQCTACGQWKRLHGRDDQGNAVQRFYPCCGENGEYEHLKQVCTNCCTNDPETTKCPYDKTNNHELPLL